MARCLHCASAKGSVRRPFGEAMHASRPNELLHWDFLAMTDGYLLVIKDDASKYLLLWESTTAEAAVVVRALLHWFGLFEVIEVPTVNVNPCMKAYLSLLRRF